MKTSKNRNTSILRITSFAMLCVVFSGLSYGCGNKAADSTPAPYSGSGQKNPAAVAPAAVAPNDPGARGGPPEAEAYRQKMGANAKAPGAR
jgi:hypothetical protein